MINDRIFHLIKVLKLNPTSFSESLDVNVTVIFNIIKGRRSKPSYDLISKILSTYKKVSTEWLIKGKGPMWADDVVATERFAPSDVRLEARIKELLAKMVMDDPHSRYLMELEELVGHMMREASEQKLKLVILHERKDAMVQVLKDKLKLKK